MAVVVICEEDDPDAIAPEVTDQLDAHLVASAYHTVVLGVVIH